MEGIGGEGVRCASAYVGGSAAACCVVWCGVVRCGAVWCPSAFLTGAGGGGCMKVVDWDLSPASATGLRRLLVPFLCGLEAAGLAGHTAAFRRCPS